MDKAHAVEYVCLRCDGKQKEDSSKVKDRQVRCKGCGGTAYCETAPVVARKAVKPCRVCGCGLRSSNSKGICSPCDSHRHNPP